MNLPVVTINGAVEGRLDETVLERLILHVGADIITIYVTGGKAKLLERLKNFNQAARHSPWIVLIDLDREPCPVEFKVQLLPNPAGQMCFRIVVRQIEAWLMADPEHLAHFLEVPEKRIPLMPESLPDSKAALLEVIRSSKNKAIRNNMLPRPELSHKEGVAYTLRLTEFVSTAPKRWRPEVAAQNAPSLARAIRCLEKLVTNLPNEATP